MDNPLRDLDKMIGCLLIAVAAMAALVGAAAALLGTAMIRGGIT